MILQKKLWGKKKRLRDSTESDWDSEINFDSNVLEQLGVQGRKLFLISFLGKQTIKETIYALSNDAFY